jgi:branched-chain amino acid transport system permease protein
MPLPPAQPQNFRDRFQQLPKGAQAGIFLALVLIIAFAPIVFGKSEAEIFSNSALILMTSVAMYAIAALGLNIVTGYTGQLNLGFCGFMAIGAYTTGLLMKHGLPGEGTLLTNPWAFYAAIPVAFFHAGIWGVLLGIPTLKLSGDYFAIVTFGFGELTMLTAKNWDSVTGGAQGLKDIPWATLAIPFTDTVIALGDRKPMWVLAVAMLSIAYALSWRVVHSRVGLAWRAIAEDEIAAQSCGIDLSVYKSLAFFLSAGLGGLAGSLLPLIYGGVYVDNFTFLFSVYVLAYVVLGGMGSFTGAFAGSLILITSLQVLRIGIERANAHWDINIDPELRMMVYGILLIVVVRLRPEGLFPSRRVAAELNPETQAIAEAEDVSIFEINNPTAGRLQ